jgi:hypothetical protein
LPENLKGKSFLPLPHLDCWYLVKGCLSWSHSYDHGVDCICNLKVAGSSLEVESI